MHTVWAPFIPQARGFLSAVCALRGCKRDRQFVRRAFCSDEGICPQKFDYSPYFHNL
jgi:hypothetical protein